MSDVFTKAISGNDYKNGSAVVGVDKTGNYDSLDPVINESVISSSALTNRFDPDEYNNVVVSVTPADSGVVSAVAGRFIEVLSYAVIADGAGTIKWLSDTSQISGEMSLAANGGISHEPDTPAMRTNIGEGLNLQVVGGGVTVAGHLAYRVR